MLSPTTGLLYPRRWLLAYGAYYLGALALAAVGLRRVFRIGGAPLTRALLLVAYLLCLSGVQSLYYVDGRHRWGVEAMLLALSGGGSAVLLDRRFRDAWGDGLVGDARTR